ncbi:phosphoribosyltransferase [Halomonas heilongjiangensis]|uniref:Phosphoribosyl transferase n=1 Tax=Halomonas heilongjiangensis TaxID=1387883 RepID=A0A2N7TQ87_9GAMM|nr:phosphoribosyltransferase family protein [Halomonas heilongjiangensis]PMR70356.1 phosphoribosyl transferase [Halomonas heilongjiangensis]PXX87375.1 phosphoribosyl transferase [Halomonas heilongjiangensis]
MFRNRREAAERLAERLSHLAGQNPLVLAIPRGGAPMGRIIADALDGELDVVLVRKVGAPGNPEFAIGAVSEDGSVYLEEEARHCPDGVLAEEIERQRELITERRRRYTPVRAPIDPRGRTVVVIDDGSATGATMAAALTTLRQRAPARLIAAIGVAPPDTVERLAALADEVVCLEAPRHFRAVGQFFVDFGQVEDDEVIALLGGDEA